MKNIEKYEKTAMLALSDKERAELAKRFDEITLTFEVLDEYDVKDYFTRHCGLDPQSPAQKYKVKSQESKTFNIMRQDVVEKFFTREKLMENAPASDGEYFSVPRVID
jgi:Asp-tRNA(Asn)/Glu-tRNA(Gln) amidotransferase C subunit